MSIQYRVPMIFPGQASQKIGMAQDLAEGSGAAAAYLATVNDALGDDLTKIMFEGPGETLTETHNAQPAILAHSVAVSMALREQGIEPSLVAGHSLGEFSAAVAAGAIDPADGLRIVRRRGELMFAAGQKTPGTMAAVLGLDGDAVREVCRKISASTGVVVVANDNSDGQIVISGEVEAVAVAGDALKEAGAKRVIGLNVSGAFHSPLLEAAAVAFRDHLAGIEVSDSSVPLVANVSAQPVSTVSELKAGFGQQLTSPVLWRDIMIEIAGGKNPPKVVLEVGPGRVLTNLAKRAYPETTFIAVGTVSDLESIGERVAEAM
ncbi:MAG: [acyl-carrier-protein] S-malonyltransferase [Candidatus Krumholzibacteriia bacterium]|jgi:[acyl-carrier-protein] S-malonyltransferase